MVHSGKSIFLSKSRFHRDSGIKSNSTYMIYSTYCSTASSISERRIKIGLAVPKVSPDREKDRRTDRNVEIVFMCFSIVYLLNYMHYFILFFITSWLFWNNRQTLHFYFCDIKMYRYNINAISNWNVRIANSNVIKRVYKYFS